MAQTDLDGTAETPGLRRALSVPRPYALHLIPLALILIQGKFFYWTNFSFEQHPLAMPGLRELYLLVSVLFAASFVLGALYGRKFYATDLALVGLILSISLICATLAYLNFGQPLPYGILEERRMGAFLSFFVFLYLIERYRIPPEALISSILVAAAIYFGLGLVLQTGILGDLTARDIPYLDPRKHRILSGVELYMVSIAISLVMVLRFHAWTYVVPMMVGAAGMLLISQTRSSMAVMALAGIIIFALSSPARFVMFAIAGLGVAVLAVFGGDLLLEAVEYAHGFLIEIFSGQSADGPTEITLDDSVRSHTASIILSELWKNGWMGMGSLSLQWNGGFHTVYDPHFFLTDVGILGEFYRFGLLLPLVYGSLFYLIYCFVSPVRDPVGRQVLIGMLVLLVCNAITGSGFISLPGEHYALLFAVAAAYRRREASQARYTPMRQPEPPAVSAEAGAGALTNYDPAAANGSPPRAS